jgi:cytochrome c553
MLSDSPDRGTDAASGRRKMPVNKRVLKSMIVALVAVGLVATVLMVGCGSSTTTQVPATTTTAKAATTTAQAATTTTGQAADGKALFTQYCSSCHKNGVGTVSASDLTRIAGIIKSGKGSMPGFADKLSAAQMTAIAAYLTTSN